MQEYILGIFSGIALALIGGYVSYFFTRRHEKLNKKEQARFEIYMDLLDLQTKYSIIVFNESRNRGHSPGQESAVSKAAWKIAHKVRGFGDLEYFDEILVDCAASYIP